MCYYMWEIKFIKFYQFNNRQGRENSQLRVLDYCHGRIREIKGHAGELTSA